MPAKRRRGGNKLKPQPASPPTSEAPKRVLVAIHSEHVVGRRILEGIADYTDHHRRWQHFLELAVHDEAILPDSIDGMIVAGEFLPSLRQRQVDAVPTVRVTGPVEHDDIPAVIVDNRAVGRMGAHYLADLGLKDLAFVPTFGIYSDHRAEGFAEVCRKRRLRFQILDTMRADDPQHLRDDLSALPAPAGIMVATDRKALEVSRACRIIGKHGPEQVALLGVDNEAEICRLVDPPLSSIDHGPRRIGYEAARLLDNWLTTGNRPTGSVMVQPVQVVVRQSTDLLAIDDPDVVAAIRYIRTHFGDAIKVEHVLEHVAMSRRSLEMHFKAALGRTVHEEIMRMRIERARQLLATSDWPMPQIASECGFALASQFSFVFKRETGQTPLAFRRAYRYGG